MKKFLLTLLIAVLSVGLSHAAYVKVDFTDGSKLDLSKEYVIVSVEKSMVMSNTVSGKNKGFTGEAVTIVNEKIETLPSNAAILKIAKSGDNFTITNADGKYLSVNGDLKFLASLTTVVLKEGKIWDNDKQERYIRYNYSNTNRFGAYKSSSTNMSEVCLYTVENDPASVAVTVNDIKQTYAPETTLAPTFSASDLGTITYEPQGDAGVVDAQLNVLKAGTQKVKATWTSTAYKNTSAEFTVTVEKAEVSLSYDKEEYSVFSTNESPEFPVLTAPEGIAVTYSSDNEKVATVNASGEVSILGIGTANITATFAGNDCYKEASASYKLEVLDDTKVQKPTFVDAPGTYLPMTQVHFNCATEGATIYFIMSESETPDMNGYISEYNPEYGLFLSAEGTWYLHIFAKKEGMTDSDIASGCFVIERGSVEDKFGFTKESETIYLGETAIYEPSLKGYNLDNTIVKYTVDNSEVLQPMYVKRGEAPKFIVLGPGTTTITANLSSSVYCDATSSMTVTVTPKPETTTFDFTKLSEDGKTVYTMTPTTDSNYYIEKQPESIGGYSFQDSEGKVTIETIKGEGNGSRLWGSTDGKYTWRVYKDVQIRISAPVNYRITDIIFTGTGSTTKLSVEEGYGTIQNGVFSTGNNINYSVVFTLTGTLEAKTIEVNYVSMSDNRYTRTLSFDKYYYEIYTDEEMPVVKFEEDSDVEIHYLLKGKEYTPGDELSPAFMAQLEAYTEMTESYYASYASTTVNILEIPAITKLNLHYTTYPNNNSPHYKTYITAEVLDGVAEFTNVNFGNNIIVNPEVDGVTTQLHCGEAYFSAAHPDNEQWTIDSIETPEEFAKIYCLYTPLAGDKTLVGQNDDLADVKINTPGSINADFSMYGIFDSFALPGQKEYNITVSDLNTSKPKVLFHYVGEATGVDNVSASNNGVVEYFNLHGVRVDEPTNGIFIRRQGDKTSKVYIR